MSEYTPIPVDLNYQRELKKRRKARYSDGNYPKSKRSAADEISAAFDRLERYQNGAAAREGTTKSGKLRVKKIGAGDNGIKRNLILKAKSGPCCDCGKKYPYYVMDLDHREPNKKLFGFGVPALQAVSVKQLKEELAKCDAVCSNCHRERTWGPLQRNRFNKEAPPIITEGDN